MGGTARIEYDGRIYEAPIIVGSEADRGIDIGKLRSDTGLITYDPGLANTASAKSAITFLDGDDAVLRYRGYPIEQLAEHSDFLETSFLLINGELPTAAEMAEFRTHITRHSLLREDLRPLFDAFPRDAHPMAILSAATAALSTFYQGNDDPFDPDDVKTTAYRLMAKLPTVAAWAYKRSIGQPYIYPRNELTYTENFLHMMFAVPAEPYEVDPDIVAALDLLLLLHADHEQNASTATVRLVGSTHANLYASVAAGIMGLWGPLHGGANEAVVRMLEQIHEGGGDTAAFIRRAKDRNDPFRLMGFGHRVYKNYDPRARIIKRAADKVIAKLVGSDPLLTIAKELEEAALSDEYFVERRLYPNVDFYSGLIYRALGLPRNMFPVMFALGRLPGWIAQWKEMVADPDTRIGRPRQIYVGPTHRDYVEISKR